jgi:hypothetical protein
VRLRRPGVASERRTLSSSSSSPPGVGTKWGPRERSQASTPARGASQRRPTRTAPDTSPRLHAAMIVRLGPGTTAHTSTMLSSLRSVESRSRRCGKSATASACTAAVAESVVRASRLFFTRRGLSCRPLASSGLKAAACSTIARPRSMSSRPSASTRAVASRPAPPGSRAGLSARATTGSLHTGAVLAATEVRRACVSERSGAEGALVGCCIGVPLPSMRRGTAFHAVPRNRSTPPTGSRSEVENSRAIPQLEVAEKKRLAWRSFGCLSWIKTEDPGYARARARALQFV